MKKLSNLWLVVAMLFASTAIFAQVSGTVSDEMGSLSDVNVKVKGTAQGTTTDFDGKFTIANAKDGVLVVSYIGYTSKEVSFKKGDKLNITIASDGESLGEVVISGVIDIAKDRQTPVAVSTIKAVEIQEKLGGQEFPEILNNTPSVYATKQGGGFGDARINIRGFNQRNVAVMINGMPVNDMENGWVYWSNWAGLSDVTSAMQVQRGLGSSKLAISSVGGTINVVTSTANQKQGGSLRTSMGNDGYQKFVASYSTGLMDNGLSASVLLSRTTGDGYVDGTSFEGSNYFIGLGYNISEKNKVMFTFTGAPQFHNQHSRATEISNYIKYGGTDDEPNRKYNPQWGSLNGDFFTWRRNFYHKPVMSINWDLELSESSKVSTVLYGSWGRGGGTGPIGQINGGKDFYGQFRDSDGQIKFDDIATWNAGGTVSAFGADRVANADGKFINERKKGFTRRMSMNSHNWYGIIANYNKKVSDNLSFDAGIDARTYKGIHYRVVNDVLGADGYNNTYRDVNNLNNDITVFEDPTPSWNPWQNITDQQKIEYYNDGNVRWLGAFGQVEYKTEKASTFMQFGVSNQGFQRTDYFNLLDDDSSAAGAQTSDMENLIGYNVKGGLNYNINDKHNVFFNTGYYSKQPLFNAVYTSYTDNTVNPDLTNEKIFGLEFGYGFKKQNYKFNANVYRTSWKDRFVRIDTRNVGVANINGVEQVHTGFELEGSMRLNKFNLNGMFSAGNWEYKKNVSGLYYDENNDPVMEGGVHKEKTLYLKGKKVGDAAQLTAGLGLAYSVNDALKFDVNERYVGNLYAQVDADDFNSEDTESLKLPGYALLDFGATYKFRFKDGKKSINFRINVNNLTDKLYISESATNKAASSNASENYRGINTSNRVYFGMGRTWNGTISFRF